MVEKRLKVLPTAWEIRRGLLRRTPSLRLLEREGVIEGDGWTLKASGEWYEAGSFYERLGLREAPQPILLLFFGEGKVVAEALPTSGKRPLSLPKEEPPPPEERPKKRVRVGGEGGGAFLAPPQEEALRSWVGKGEGKEEERRPVPQPPSSPLAPASLPQGGGSSQGGAPFQARGEAPVPLREVHALLWEMLGEEEFGRQSVDPYLRYRGYDPDSVWQALSQAGCLEERGGFLRLLPLPSPRSPLKKLVIEETQDLPSYLRP